MKNGYKFRWIDLAIVGLIIEGVSSSREIRSIMVDPKFAAVSHEMLGQCTVGIIRIWVMVLLGVVTCIKLRTRKSRSSPNSAILMRHAMVKRDGFTVPLIGVPASATNDKCDACHQRPVST